MALVDGGVGSSAACTGERVPSMSVGRVGSLPPEVRR